jgi:four helix bundle protein
MIQSHEDLVVYQRARSFAKEIFAESTKFPKEEMYSLTIQIRRSSRSIVANIAEGYAKRHFENIFRRHLVDAYGSCIETKAWLQICQDCNYITEDSCQSYLAMADEIARMTYSLIQTWRSTRHTS